MRVALVEVRLGKSSRAANLSRLLQRFDEACRAEPAPDLVILPEACDTGRPGHPVQRLTLAMAESFSASLAAKAREWGVYVCGGYHGFDDEMAVVSVGALYDPDGDTIVRRAVGTRGDARGSGLAVATVSLGVCGVRLGSEPYHDCEPGALADAGATLVIVPAADMGDGAQTVADRCQDMAQSIGVSVCTVVGLALEQEGRRRRSRAVSSDGATIVESRGDREQTLFADLPVAAAKR
jgi:predicted amidohydrolase